MTTSSMDMKILICDDSPNMLRTVANMLRGLGYTNVIRADDGDTALRRIRSEKVEMVMCDWNMPRMTGIEVLRAVREDDQLKSLPFMMVTGEMDEKIVAEAGEVEVDAYLVKPFTQEDLKSKLDEVLNKKRSPSQIDIHLSVAQVYMEARQYQLALEELKKALKLGPRSPRVSYALAQVFEAQNDLEKAKALYQRSVEFGHQFLKGHESLARVFQQQGDLPAATAHLRAAVNISPKNLDRQIALSRNLIQLGEKDEAQSVLQNVLKIADKNKGEVARQVGEAYMDYGMPLDAQHAFSQALELDPKSLHLYNRLGMALRRQKKFNEAVDNYKIAIQIDPEDENLYYNLGRAYYEAGDKPRAVMTMKKALQIYPDFQEAKDFLARVGED